MSKIHRLPPRSTTRLHVSMPFQEHWTYPVLWATHNDEEGWTPVTLLSTGYKLRGVAPSTLRDKPDTMRWWLEWQAPQEEEEVIT